MEKFIVIITYSYCYSSGPGLDHTSVSSYYFDSLEEATSYAKKMCNNLNGKYSSLLSGASYEIHAVKLHEK